MFRWFRGSTGMTDVLFAGACSFVYLILSAVLLLTGFIYLHGPYADVPAGHRWDGASLSLIGTEGLQVDGGLRLPGLDRPISISISDLSVRAQDYPVAYVDARGLSPGTAIVLSWHSAGKAIPERLLVQSSGDGITLVNLSKVRAWSGIIKQLGLRLVGRQDAAFSIQALGLESWTPGTVLRLLWSQWMGFEGWSGHSIHFIQGGHADPLVHPVSAAAAWAGLALLLYITGHLLRGRSRPLVPVMLFVCAWLALDVRWQWDMGRQLLATFERYAGKSWIHKRLVAEDGRLFQFILLARRQLPDSPQRIFLAANPGEGPHKYWRLRAAYHLLPNNVYSHPEAPDSTIAHAQAGEYVLLLHDLDPAGRLQDADVQRILSGGGLRAEALYRHDAGVLYRVEKTAAERLPE